MRRAAERVDDQMLDYMGKRVIPGPWRPTAERLLVCISPGAISERLIRSARRLADGLSPEWYAIFVETPGQTRMSTEQHDRVDRHVAPGRRVGC